MAANGCGCWPRTEIPTGIVLLDVQAAKVRDRMANHPMPARKSALTSHIFAQIGAPFGELDALLPYCIMKGFQQQGLQEALSGHYGLDAPNLAERHIATDARMAGALRRWQGRDLSPVLCLHVGQNVSIFRPGWKINAIKFGNYRCRPLKAKKELVRLSGACGKRAKLALSLSD